MSMFTTCPKCSLKLVVTAADLRVAQGYVRCGRCSNVFNALAGLSDEQQAVLAREQAAAEPASTHREPLADRERAPPPKAEPRAPPPPPPQPTTPRKEEPIPDEKLEFDPVTTDVSEVFVEATDDDPTGTFESIVLRSEDVEVQDESAETHELEIDLEAVVAINTTRAEPEVPREQAPAPATPTPLEPPVRDRPSHEAAPSTAAPEPAPPAEPPRPSPEPYAGREARTRALAAELARTPHERAAPAEDESTGRTPGIVDRGLRIGSIVLAVILALQIVNHERAELAGISWLRAPLTHVYSALGVPIAPHWNVHAYEVRQLGAVAGPRDPGALTVRASVKNTAPREQPLPLLRVTMQDRFGNRIAARDVPPSAYLPAGSSTSDDLAAGQRVDAEIAFADPGPNAVGFEIDACLELASGRVACANDTPER